MALSTSVRATPVGIPLKNGHRTFITIAADTDISFWEKAVKPPGLDGGQEVDITTMFNTAARTFSPRALTMWTPTTCKAAYTPALYDQLQAVLNVETSITIKFSNNATLDFYGWLKLAEMTESSDGTQPEINITFFASNTDPLTGMEVGPNFKTATGTD